MEIIKKFCLKFVAMFKWQMIILCLLIGDLQKSVAQSDSSFFNDSNGAPQIQMPWHPGDSIRLALQNRPSFSLWYDSRRSFIGSQPVIINGLRYGMSWGKISGYTGYYYSANVAMGEVDSIQQRYGYFSSTMEYNVYQTHRYSLELFGQMGGGLRSSRHKDLYLPVTRNLFLPLEFGLNGSVRFLKYLGISAGMGYRVAFFRGGQNFSGPIFCLGFTCFPMTIYRDSKKLLKRHNIQLQYLQK